MGPELYRQTVWPYLYTRLADQEEADRWRVDIEAEITRLAARLRHERDKALKVDHLRKS